MYFFLDWLEWFDDSAYSEVIVVFGTIESTNNQIDDTEMIVIGLFFSLGHFSSLLLFSLQSLHNLLSLFVLVYHNIADTQIGNYDGCQAEHVICIFIYNWLIISDGFVVSLKHEEDMSYVQFPSLVICTELGTLSEKFLYDWVILFIPINLGLGH